MVLNAGKYNFMCLRNNTENETFLFNNILIENTKETKILGVIIDNKFSENFNLSRLSSYLHISEKKLIQLYNKITI